MEITKEMQSRLELLEKKFASLGQSMEAYLDGLLYADYLTYWDYIRVDTLLSLQQPLTPFPDEKIFILYHQITELYFKLIRNAVEQLQKEEQLSPQLFKRQIKRINGYFEQLINSFGIMIEGMDKEEFLKFRMSLLPASGFQSAQYRMIEIISTDMPCLVHYQRREGITPENSIHDLYQNIYWKFGATELATGKKTLTLKQFEVKYGEQLVRLAQKVKDCNIWQLYKKLPKEAQADESIIQALKEHDINANVLWPLSHYRSAVKHLNRQPEIIAATGGTNWQQYLPPRNQRIIFYPELWTEEELENWGKSVRF